MIVDTKSDLNVYVDMAKGATTKDGDAAGCCGQSSKGADFAAIEDTASSCDVQVSTEFPCGQRQVECCSATDSKILECRSD
jgi:hypothetical protein